MLDSCVYQAVVIAVPSRESLGSSNMNRLCKLAILLECLQVRRCLVYPLDRLEDLSVGDTTV